VGPIKGETLTDDLLFSKKKGPLQWNVAAIVHMFEKDVYKEISFRAPYMLASLGSVLFFYLFTSKVSGSFLVSYFSTFLFSINGFTVAFGRIVQYQSLNMFFSFGLLYFVSLYMDKKSRYAFFLASIFFALSFLSHWDAVYVLPLLPLLYAKDGKLKSVILIMLVSLVILLPYMIPYLLNLSSSSGGKDYLLSRMGLVSDMDVFPLLEKVLLYNPFYFLQGILVFSLFSLTCIKKSWPYLVWFLFVFVWFLFMFKRPGTHVYNLLFPLYILSGYGLLGVTSLLPKIAKVVPLIFASAFAFVLTYQSFILFSDHEREYPWESEDIFSNKTKQLTHEDLQNYIIGFTHDRDWYGIRDAVIEMKNQDPQLGHYITNENKNISNYYLDMEYGVIDKDYLAIGIKRPLNFANDYSFPQIRNKSTIKKISVDDENVVRIYLVRSSQE